MLAIWKVCRRVVLLKRRMLTYKTTKAGGVVVSVSPMSMEKELEYVLNDSSAVALFAFEGFWLLSH